MKTSTSRTAVNDELTLISISYTDDMKKRTDPLPPLENLFRPGTGDQPPYLAGREQEQAVLHGLLRNLTARRNPPRHAVAFGPRGNGKTTLLRAVEQHCQEAGIHTLWLAAPALQSQESFVQAILRESLKQGRKTPEKPLQEGVMNLLQWLQPDLSVGPMQARVRLKDPACRQQLQGTTVRDLPDVIVSGPEYRAWTPFVLFLDEAHQMDPNLGHALLNDAQRLIGEKMPFLLILAGTPQLRPQLQKMRTTFWERAEILPIWRLAPAATEAAITLPLAEHRLAVEPTALTRVVAATQDYPYFIQLWGEALCHRYIAAPEERITARHVAWAEQDVQAEQQMFYGERYQETTAQRLESLARVSAQLVLHQQKYPLLSKTDPSQRLGPIYSQIEDYLHENTDLSITEDALPTLEALGFLWRPDSRTVEPGIPSLMQFRSLAIVPIVSSLLG